MLCESREIAGIGINSRKSERKVARKDGGRRSDFFAVAQPLDESGEFGRRLCAEVSVEGVFEVLVVSEGIPPLAVAGVGADESGVRLA